MARAFKDGNGTGYNGTDAKFENTPFGTTLPSEKTSTADWVTEASSYIPFDFGSKTGLEQKVDNSVLGNMMDCGECHVGGGAMEYIPNATPAARVPLRTAGTTGGILDGLWTAFNSFIDIFGPKGDGKDVTFEGKQIDFAQSGVLEMDCLQCHLKDYSWEERKKAVRMAKFDASRAVGAGIAAFGSYTTTSSGGRTVVYDPAKVVFANSSTASGGYKLAPVVAQNILSKPDSANCATCHFATEKEKYQVEWKKRGDYWGASEVHGSIGCMGCHGRKDLTVSGTIDPANVGTSGTPNLAAANKKLGLCDPAKGGDCSYDAQWNAMDKVAFKNCTDCHNGTAGNGLTYGAPNPSTAHQNAGLLAKVVQKQYSSNGQLIAAKDGVASATHLDVIDCTTCHVRKLDVTVATYNADGTFKNYSTFRINGGAMVDGTGADEEGRVATHDTVNVERDMKDNIALYWNNGKMFVGNFLSSWYIRDVNGLTDFNNDGRGGGIDPPLPTHVAKINKLAGLHEITNDGVVNGTEIGQHFTAIQSNLNALIGRTPTGDVATDAMLLKLSMAGVPFKISHNTAPAASAWGSASRGGCADCHSAGSGFYNGNIVISPKTAFTYSSNQVAPFALVNGSVDATDGHPSVVNKSGLRTVPVKVVTSTKPTQTTLTDQSLADVNKSMLLYENTFQTRDFAWKTSITGAVLQAACAVDANGKPLSSWYCDSLEVGGVARKAAGSTATKGWLLKIETKADGSSTVVTRTKQVSSDTLTNVTDLVANLGTKFCNDFEFTIAKDTADEKLVISAKSGYSIRISPQSDVAPLGLAGALWKTEPIKGVIGGASYDGRTAYVGYLNGITKETAGVDINPVASIGTITDADNSTAGVQVVVNLPVSLSAGEAQTFNSAPVGFSTYTWSTSDGAAITPDPADKKKASVTFTSTGSKTITLTVNDEEGKRVVTTTTVQVVVQPITVTPTTATKGVSKSFTIANLPTGAYKMKIYWGDGSYQFFLATATPAHTYATAGSKAMQIYVFNSSGSQIGYKAATITVSN